MKKIFIISVLCITHVFCNAQYIWYFGDSAGLKFSCNNLPTAYVSPNKNPVKTKEGCAMAYDDYGNVIMSTNGVTLFNKNNQPMPNGTGLMGGNSATQSSIFIPVPNCSTKYFLFTLAETETNHKNGFRYSIIDMTLDGGNGDVMPNRKNVPLITMITSDLPDGSKFKTYCAERLAVCKDGTGGYWIVVQGMKGNWNNLMDNMFFSFHLTPQNTGTCNYPQVDTASNSCTLSFVTSVKTRLDDLVGQLKFSPSGSKLAYASKKGGFDLFDFNLQTGLVTSNYLYNPYVLLSGYYTYGLEFSPNEKYLYVCENFIQVYTSVGRSIYQFDITTPNIAATKTQIAFEHADTISSNNSYSYGSMQLWKDGRIYVANAGEKKIGVIMHPNLQGLAADYKHNFISLPPNTTSNRSLPAFIVNDVLCTSKCGNCHNISFDLDKNYSITKDTTIITGCGQQLRNVAVNKNCAASENYTVTGVVVKDKVSSAPAWASTFVASKGTGSLNPPPASRSYSVTYYFGNQNPVEKNRDTCDRITITVKDTCCACNPEDRFRGNIYITNQNKTIDSVYCNKPLTTKLTCGVNYKFFAPVLTDNSICQAKDSLVIKSSNGVVVIPAPKTNTSDPFIVNFSKPGTYNLVFLITRNGKTCRECSITVMVECDRRINNEAIKTEIKKADGMIRR